MSEPTILEVTLGPLSLVGLSVEFVSGLEPGSDAHLVIPPLWGRLMDVVRAQHVHHDWSVGVMTDAATEGKMKYLAALRIQDFPSPPSEFEHFDLAGGKYLACEHVGSLESIGQTTAWFYTTYLPASGHVVRAAPHLEIYDERFDPHSESSIASICAPI